MKLRVVFLLLSAALGAQAQDFLDDLDQALTFSALHQTVRARISGTIDLEYYNFSQPPPGLINSTSDNLFTPRLTLFLDAQYAEQFYFFAQSRLDRGFDPSDQGAEVRLDEYALRFTPAPDGWLVLQAGKFATVVGNFAPRHLSWDNPFVNAPLVYENVTAIEDGTGEVPRDFHEELFTEKYEFIPVVWGPSYATGFSASGRVAQFEYATEIKNASLSSRPEEWDLTARGLDHPTFSGRIGYRPSQAWNFGVSASDGSYLRDEAERALPRGRSVGDYREKVLAQDASFAWRHLQLWAEFYEARFEVPRLGDGDTFAWYLEAKYKFIPQLFAAVRWNQQLFSSIERADGTGERPLGDDLWRTDAAVAYRFTPHTQLKVQYSFQKETSGACADNHLFASQFTLRF